jgi:hypothetical protein
VWYLSLSVYRQARTQACKHENAYVATPTMSHLQLFTWYDFNPTSQHGWSWANFYPDQLEAWLDAWHNYQMPGMWNLEYLTFGGEKFWNRSCLAETNWNCGLRPGWQAALTPALQQLQPYIDIGALQAIFLGDEPMLSGISASNITSAANFIRAHVGPKPKIYWNDGCRPFYDGHVEPCVRKPGHNPRACWTNESKVPASVDWVSCDQYEDPTKATSPYPWFASAANPEADAQRFFADHFIKSKLHEHQRVVLVPGIFGNRSDGWTDKYLTEKLQGYWKWAQEDSRVAGFNPWHFNDRTWYVGCKDELPGTCNHTLSGSGLTPCCYKFGAVSYPKMLDLAQHIGGAILNASLHTPKDA